jgi:hypothetical protein
MKETEHGLALPQGADPSWWSTDELSTGLPTPGKVRSWWEDAPPDPPSGEAGHTGPVAETNQKPHTYAENSIQEGVGQAVDTSTFPGCGTGDLTEPTGHIQPLSSEGMDTDNGLSKRNTVDEGGVSSVSSASSVRTSTYIRATENPTLIADDDEGVNI